MGPHDIAEDQGGADVVGVVFQRHSGGFADSLVAGKMDDSVDVFFVKKICQGRSVIDIQFVEGRAPAGDLLDPVNDQGFGVIKIVRYDHVIARVQKLHAGMAADKTCSACN